MSLTASEAAAAEKEMVGLLAGPLAAMSLGEVKGEFDKAMDEVERRKNAGGNDNESKGNTRTPTAPKTITSIPEIKKLDSRKIWNGEEPKAKQAPSVVTDICLHWQCLVERLQHVSCYSITLTETRDMKREHTKIVKVEVDLHSVGESMTSVRVCDEASDILVSLSLPDRIFVGEQGSRPFVDQLDGSISLRLPYGDRKSDEKWAILDDGDDLVLSTTHNSIVENLPRLSCRSCAHNLLASDADVREYFRLPIGCWDDVADYLTCYEGQPALDLGIKSMTIHRGTALDDESVLVLHKDDLGCNVCVLAISGYGDAENDRSEPSSRLADPDVIKDGAGYRGLRRWSDSVGGATICCSNCCAPIGFASLENPVACRLFKHRLSTTEQRKRPQRPERETVVTRDIFAKNTCASFLAKDMVRYAESQAVYTFVVTDGRSRTGNEQACLLLKLLSWDTLVATSLGQEDRSVVTSCFRKGVKVIYKSVEDFSSAFGSGAGEDDISSLTWGGIDLCCPPMPSRKASRKAKVDKENDENSETEVNYSSASVQIFLTSDEFAEVIKVIHQNASYFSKTVTQASLTMKLGKDETQVGCGLSMVPIG